MEKLVKLLNEYEKEKGRNYEWKEFNGALYYLNLGMFSELLLVSKRYGFIKWLVDNDKIDIEKLNILKEPFVEAYYYHHLKSPKDCENGLIMILSIIYNPIGYLCGILKE